MCARWTYGAEGSAYPVQVGQTWRCGQHLFGCGPLAAWSAFVTGQHPAVVYSDPPWNQGNVNSFRTKAGLGAAGLGDWLDIYRRIFKLAGGAPCFLEGGRQQAAEVANMLAAQTPAPVEYRQWPITYYRRHPAVLHYAGPPLGGLDGLAGLDDDDTPAVVLTAFPRGVVADPCAGRGLTSRAAASLGWASVNVELHPNRMSAALARLVKATGWPAEPLDGR